MALYDDLGGAPAVAAVVDLFYDNVLSDPALVGYFDGTDLARLKAHQRAFVAAALGGAERYSGKSMQEAHAGRGITSEAFDAVVGHLGTALLACGASPDQLAEVVELLAPLKAAIATAGVGAG